MPDTSQLLLAALGGVAFLLVLVIYLKLHAFVALLLASMAIGIGAGMTPDDVLKAMQTGMGNTLGFIAVVVGVGSMLGGMLEISGGAQSLASNLTRIFGPKRTTWALGFAGFLVSIPVFFDVGLVILVPVLYGLAQKTKRPLMTFALPLMAGMVTTHAFVPPTPGPTLVAHELGASLGYVVGFGILVGIPCMILAGPVFANFIAPRVVAAPPGISLEAPTLDATAPSGDGGPQALAPHDSGLDASGKGAEDAPPAPSSPLPSLELVILLIGLPLLLMVIGATIPDKVEGSVAPILKGLKFLGHPFVALLITVLLCFRLLGTRRGLTRDEVQAIAGRALEPAGIILLVTGAGGVLKQVMVDSKVGTAVAEILTSSNLPVLLVGFLFAAAVRVMQGSATVAMVAAAAFTSQLVAGADLSEPLRALLVLSIASGATFSSHVNDSGFWLVNRYLGLSVADTFRSWTAMTVIIGLVGLAMTLVIGAFV